MVPRSVEHRRGSLATGNTRVAAYLPTAVVAKEMRCDFDVLSRHTVSQGNMVFPTTY
jgi:hypothetical protein